ncbi:zinc ribbon domain-containing protein [Niveibacterium sp. SC-1]|uniref:zinc ribbon domain-containing protein n=1 Tax=Niveibacterium sp. SC-1 TaxID=3135646 RepID=UPI00311E21DD
MPLFDFHCEVCDRTYELLLRGGTDPVCPHCGSTNMTKLIPAISPAARTPGMVQRARQQANREGHFSNFNAAERKRILKT